MKYRVIILFSICCAWFSLKAQITSVEAAGNYLYSGQWDRAIQTLNFNRFNFGTQPLLRFGFTVGTSYRFNKTSSPYGLSGRYGLVWSVNDFPGRSTVLQLHQLAIHYTYTWKPSDQQPLFICLSGGALSTLLLRKIESQYYVYDERVARAVGIGPELALRTYYTLRENSKFTWSPFLSCTYSPFLWSPQTEALINQTGGFTSNAFTMLTQVQLGVIFNIN